MNKENLKLCLVRDKTFLKSLYEGPDSVKNYKILSSADDIQLITLLKYLHFLANGKNDILIFRIENLLFSH